MANLMAKCFKEHDPVSPPIMRLYWNFFVSLQAAP